MKKVFSLFLLSFIAIAALSQTLHAQWVEANRPQPSNSGNGAIINYKGTLYFWNEQNGMQKSTDNGKTWIDTPDSTLPTGTFQHITKLSAASDRIYAAVNFGTGTGAVAYSDNEGLSWKPDTLGAPGHALGWEGMPAVRDLVVWGHWLYVSWDGPNMYDIKTFDGPYKRNTYLSTGGQQPYMVAAKGDTLFSVSNTFVFTTDGGETWQTPKNNGYKQAFRIYIDGNRIYTFANKQGGGPCAIFYTDDNGDNFKELDIDSVSTKRIVNGDYMSPVAVFMKGEKIWYSGTQTNFNTTPNLFRTTDFGNTWDRDTVGLPSVFFDNINGFAYANDGTLWAMPGHGNLFTQKIDGGDISNVETPAAPTLVSPPNGQVTEIPMVDLTWNPSPKTAKYHLQVAKTAQFDTLLLNNNAIVDTMFRITGLPVGNTYYWRVAAISSEGVEGLVSATRSFTIVPVSGVAIGEKHAFSLSPNPAHDKAILNFGDNAATGVAVYNTLGQLVMHEEVIPGAKTHSLLLGSLMRGNYVVVISTMQGKEAMRLLVQ